MTTTAAPSAIRVKMIDHVTLVVADLERSRAFYCDVLGMDCVTRPDFKFPGLWFQAGATQIHLVQEHDQSAPAGFPSTEFTSARRTFHYAFEVDDAAAARNILQAAGVRMKGEPHYRPDGCFQVFCYDPDGHVVEIFSRP